MQPTERQIAPPAYALLRQMAYGALSTQILWTRFLSQLSRRPAIRPAGESLQRWLGLPEGMHEHRQRGRAREGKTLVNARKFLKTLVISAALALTFGHANTALAQTISVLVAEWTASMPRRILSSSRGRMSI